MVKRSDNIGCKASVVLCSHGVKALDLLCALQEIFKKVRSILNKLTPQKFQTLVQQVLDLDINSEAQLKGVVDIISEKAINEPSFSVAYANMCKCMVNVSLLKYVAFLRGEKG